MTIQHCTALVLQQIDAALALADKAKELETLFASPEHAAFIATSRTLLPTSLRCLKDDIQWFLEVLAMPTAPLHQMIDARLAALCDQWEATL